MTELKMKEKRSSAANGHLADTIFLTSFGIYLFCLCLGTTMFPIIISDVFYYILLVPMAVSAVFRLIKERKNISLVKMILELLVFAGYIVTFIFTGYQFLLFLAFITVGMTNMDYRKPMNIFIAVALLVLLIAIAGAMSGAIQNVVYSRGRGTRSAMGIVYPTDFASYILFVCVAVYAVYHKSAGILIWPLMALPLLAAVFIANSRTTMITGGLLLVIVVFNALAEKLKLYTKKWFSVPLTFLEMIAFPLCAAAFFGIVYLYVKNNNIGFALNKLFSNRPKLTFESYKLYGIKPFGNIIELVGFGRSVFNDASYNFVDSTYPLLLIRYGLVVFSIVMILWMYLSAIVNRKNKAWIGLLLALLAIHGISEHHLIELNYNIFLALPFASFEGAEPEFK